MSLSEDQWEALGRRLARLERLVESLPELGDQTTAARLAGLLEGQAAALEAQLGGRGADLEAAVVGEVAGVRGGLEELRRGQERLGGEVVRGMGPLVDMMQRVQVSRLAGEQVRSRLFRRAVGGV